MSQTPQTPLLERLNPNERMVIAAVFHAGILAVDMINNSAKNPNPELAARMMALAYADLESNPDKIRTLCLTVDAMANPPQPFEIDR